MQQKYGEEANNFNAEGDGVKEGLNHDRGCTDILCLLVFIAFLGSMGYLTFFANMNGDVAKLYAPIDGDNHLCGYQADNAGIDNEYRTYNKLFISNLKAESVASIFESGVCVETCPKAGDAVKFRKTSHVEGGVEAYDTTEVVTYCFPHASSLPDDMV